VEISYLYADLRNDRLPALAADLVRRRVAVIYAGGRAAALAAKSATPTIPIVFLSGADPVELGLVASLNPGGNATGVSFLIEELTAKRLELLHEILPAAILIGFLKNPTLPQVEAEIGKAKNAARILGVRLVIANASTPSEIEAAFENLAGQRIGALVVANDPLFGIHQRNQLVTLAARRVLPTMYFSRESVEAGGLMSYGASISDISRQAGIYVGRILKGEKPADLPVQQVTRFELVINLKTAKALGLTIPETLLAPADEVIQ
jgi:putative ABC transport system substrate-binding protein